MELGGRRLGQFSTTTRRWFVGVALIPYTFAMLNDFCQWHLFGRFDKAVMPVSILLLFLVLRYLGPTIPGRKRGGDADAQGR